LHPNIPVRSTELTDYSLWKVTKKIKSKLLHHLGDHVFAEHLANVFQAQPSENEPEEEARIQLLESPYQLKPSINHIKKLKFKKSLKPSITRIKKLKFKKSSTA
jgi:hypothetical protein